MLVYLAVILLIIIFNQSLIRFSSHYKRELELKYARILMFLLIAIATLRASTVGTDTAGYIRDYETVRNMTYTMVFQQYINNPGYYLVSKFFSNLGISVQIWFGIIETMYMVAINKIIKKYSGNVMLSYLMFLTLGFYTFSMAGLKQTMAMAFALLAFNYLVEKKYIVSIILFFISIFFHLTAMVMIFAVLIYLLKKNKLVLFALLVVFIVTLLYYNAILSYVLGYMDNEHYSTYLNDTSYYSAVVLILQIFILMISVLFIKRYLSNNKKEAIMMYGMCGLGIISQVFAFAVASAFRLSFYFSVFGIVLLPKALRYEKDGQKRSIWIIVLYSLFIFYFLYTNRNGSSVVPYRFFWVK